jgi:hypothetical protein
VSDKALRDLKPKQVDALTREFEDELLVYDIQTFRAHCLNHCAARVWVACDGRTPVSKIARDQFSLYGMTEQLVWLALRRLERAGLLESTEEFKSNKVLSRREGLRKIVVTAGVAAPLVVSMVVPTPAMAASCFPLAHACTTDLQCCSGRCGVSGVGLVCLP